MTFADVAGHAAAVARLRRVAAEGRVPGAVLLLGPPGVGKRVLADAFAARLLCQAPVADDACGVCAQCTRVAAGTHPDVHVITREEERRDVRIEQVRELTRWLTLQPLMAARKVGLLDDAHCLNEHGQNALLKTLEEPPGASTLVLIASSAALLLPTVRSRCQVVRLDPLPPDAVARVLEARGVPAERRGTLAALAEGSPGRALALAGAEQMRARERVLEALPRLRDLPAHEVSKLAQDISRGELDAALTTALGWYRDVLQTTLVGEALPLRNPGSAAAVHAAAGRVSPVAMLRQLEVVCDTIADLEKNANRMLSIETMLLWLREIERGPRAGADEGSSWKSAP
jgi:DNA polymerase-3 subunit delta'